MHEIVSKLKFAARRFGRFNRTDWAALIAPFDIVGQIAIRDDEIFKLKPVRPPCSASPAMTRLERQSKVDDRFDSLLNCTAQFLDGRLRDHRYFFLYLLKKCRHADSSPIKS